MKVLEKALMKDGTKIQIEDWTKDYDFIKVLNIASYPIAKRTNYKDILRIPTEGDQFRISIKNFKNDNEVKEVFEKLKTGSITLLDLKNKFDNKNNADYI
ncbi:MULTISPECIES: hypothetical protein [unclassified Clostridium]|uniref:hypothetical protein n=1 Tax=unclassified Clostridium TaxID=2614128 RepID=UPI00207AC25E|nr:MULTISPECIES: hypothetical protein [unclassified Clostridium]